MKIFKHIDEIVNYYETIRNSYFPIAEEIKTALEEIVCANSLYSLSVLYRIKEAGSVREKMIKNSSYRIFTEKEDTIASLKILSVCALNVNSLKMNPMFLILFVPCLTRRMIIFFITMNNFPASV